MKNDNITKEEFQKIKDSIVIRKPTSVILDISVPPDVAELLKQEAEFQKRLYDNAAERASEAVKQVDKEILEYIEPNDDESLSEYLNRKKVRRSSSNG